MAGGVGGGWRNFYKAEYPLADTPPADTPPRIPTPRRTPTRPADTGGH